MASGSTRHWPRNSTKTLSVEPLAVHYRIADFSLLASIVIY